VRDLANASTPSCADARLRRIFRLDGQETGLIVARVWMPLALALVLAACSRPPAVAVVDLEAVARALGRDDAMTRQVQTLDETLRLQLREAAELLREELQAERDALGEEASETQRARFERLLAEANGRLEESQRVALLRSSRFREDVVQGFRREVAGIARQIAARHHIPAVLSSDASLLWFDASLDITDEVIAEMRERARVEATGTGEITGPAAAGVAGEDN
jgi:Skp family chaperone for outer membrane proteins